MSFRDRLAAIVSEHGLSKLASASGVDAGTLHNMASGKRGGGPKTSYETVVAVAKAAGVRHEWLWGGEEPRELEAGPPRWQDHPRWAAHVALAKEREPGLPYEAAGAMTMPPGCATSPAVVETLALAVARAQIAAKETAASGVESKIKPRFKVDEQPLEERIATPSAPAARSRRPG